VQIERDRVPELAFGLEKSGELDDGFELASSFLGSVHLEESYDELFGLSHVVRFLSFFLFAR
jgi:hypothetical protein